MTELVWIRDRLIIVMAFSLISLFLTMLTILFIRGTFPIPNPIHKHKWDYERHNSLIIRACDCGAVEGGTIIEEPELVASTRTDISKAKNWKAI